MAFGSRWRAKECRSGAKDLLTVSGSPKLPELKGPPRWLANAYLAYLISSGYLRCYRAMTKRINMHLHVSLWGINSSLLLIIPRSAPVPFSRSCR